MSSVKKIWLIRHGSYITVDEGGHPNDPILSPLGIEQAKRLNRVFGDRVFDEIRISPINRARETFEHSKCRGHRVLFDTRLLEVANPARYRSLLPYTTPDYAEADQWDTWLEEALPRAQALIEDLKSSPAQEILLFSHWAFLGTLMMTALGFKKTEHPLHAYTRTSHCCYSLLEIEEGQPIRMVHWNINAHLEGLEQGKELTRAPKIQPTDK